MSKKPPLIYFAGKISQPPSDWRCQLGLSPLADTPDDPLDPELTYTWEDGFDYAGPFFVSSSNRSKHDLFELNRLRIKRAHVVFAYVNETDCFDTMVELGVARCYHKVVILVLGLSLTDEDVEAMGILQACADHVFHGEVMAVWDRVLFGLIVLYPGSPGVSRTYPSISAIIPRLTNGRKPEEPSA
jgi:hypothetical protein